MGLFACFVTTGRDEAQEQKRQGTKGLHGPESGSTYVCVCARVHV